MSHVFPPDTFTLSWFQGDDRVQSLVEEDTEESELCTFSSQLETPMAAEHTTYRCEAELQIGQRLLRRSRTVTVRAQETAFPNAVTGKPHLGTLTATSRCHSMGILLRPPLEALHPSAPPNAPPSRGLSGTVGRPYHVYTQRSVTKTSKSGGWKLPRLSPSTTRKKTEGRSSLMVDSIGLGAPGGSTTRHNDKPAPMHSTHVAIVSAAPLSTNAVVTIGAAGKDGKGAKEMMRRNKSRTLQSQETEIISQCVRCRLKRGQQPFLYRREPDFTGL
uniref:Uncharacterized protein n=1 Tax=Sphaerodactylus townsendi TaxID=933632 RepID=A0ACB8F201_9SAUR